MQVFVNGVLQDSADYHIAEDYVTFDEAPVMGDRIEFRGIPAQTFSYTVIAGAVRTKKFKIDQIWQDTIEMHTLINQAWDHRDHTMIKDALERLQAAVALLKE